MQATTLINKARDFYVDTDPFLSRPVSHREPDHLIGDAIIEIMSYCSHVINVGPGGRPNTMPFVSCRIPIARMLSRFGRSVTALDVPALLKAMDMLGREFYGLAVTLSGCGNFALVLNLARFTSPWMVSIRRMDTIHGP